MHVRVYADLIVYMFRSADIGEGWEGSVRCDKQSKSMWSGRDNIF